MYASVNLVFLHTMQDCLTILKIVLTAVIERLHAKLLDADKKCIETGILCQRECFEN